MSTVQVNESGVLVLHLLHYILLLEDFHQGHVWLLEQLLEGSGVPRLEVGPKSTTKEHYAMTRREVLISLTTKGKALVHKRASSVHTMQSIRSPNRTKQMRILPIPCS